MKRFIIIVAILVSIALCGALAHAEGGSKVLLIPREGYSADIEYMLWNEVWPMRLMLMKAGFKLEVATASGRPIISPGRDLEPDLRLDEVKVSDYVGLLCHAWL